VSLYMVNLATELTTQQADCLTPASSHAGEPEVNIQLPHLLSDAATLYKSNNSKIL